MMNEKRCFLCLSKMDEKTGLCTNPNCVRSKPLPPPEEKEKDDAGTEEQQ